MKNNLTHYQIISTVILLTIVSFIISTIIIASLIFVVSTKINTPPIAPPIYTRTSLDFLIVGDWGIPNSIQYNVAKQLNNYATNIKFNSILSMGDNFYSTGVTSTNDPLWTNVWRNVYLNLPNIKNLTWYVVLGNHDW
jgi:predicted ATP-grasp superfamily ATP-dependent carboligase